MLDELHVSNIALIQDASISFSPGLTVLTGETGAGKTALLSALQLITGRRADSKAVRDGASEGMAEARFISGNDELVVRRRLSAAGRSRCTIDGAMATVAELSAKTTSIRLHSQHEQVLLLQPATQLSYLDSWISADGAHLCAYQSARKAYLQARAAYEKLASAKDAAAQELEFMRFTATEIEKVNPQQGEYEQLEAELPRLQHAEQLAVAVQTALSSLHDDGAALDLLAEGANALARQGGIDPELDGLADRMADLQAELEDFARDLRAYADTVQYDPGRLQDVLDRLDELSGIMKRFGPSMELVFEAWDKAKAAVSSAQASPERLDAAKREMEAARGELLGAAQDLSKTRKQAAPRFCAQLAEAVHELSMEGASFEFSFEELPETRWGDAGSEAVELLYRPAPAASARPLGRIASGGELSRILLALECIYHGTEAAADHDRTIVFDEVDQGIGGATGSAVARRIAQLARHAQVIVVTHLPQVAALADEHYVVSKQTGADLPVTRVEKVTGEERVREIARMLAGTLDATALDHARSLLAGADVR